MRRAAAVAAAGSVALTAGCGGDGLPRELTPGQRADLHTLVDRARTAAGAGDLAATDAALERLKARVRTLREAGALDEAHAAELLKHAALAELKAERTISPPAATPAPAPATAPPAVAPPAVTPPAAAPPGQAEGGDKKDKDDKPGKGEKGEKGD